MFGATDPRAGHERESSRSADSHHIFEGLPPCRIVFHALTGDHGIKTIVRAAVILTLANQIDARPRTDVDSNVTAILEQRSNRPVYVMGSNLKDLTVVKKLRLQLSELAHEVHLCGMRQT